MRSHNNADRLLGGGAEYFSSEQIGRQGNKSRNDRSAEQNNRNDKLLSRWQIAGINEGRVVFSSTTSVCAAVKGIRRVGTGVASLAWFIVYCRGGTSQAS